MFTRAIRSWRLQRLERKFLKQSWRTNLVGDCIHKILLEQKPTGRVLNIGAAAAEYDPLNFSYFREQKNNIELFGININPKQLGKHGNFLVIGANAHKMPFQSESFDCILCNAMLEHDPRFWLTLKEIRRILKARGLFVAGMPGYGNTSLKRWWPSLKNRAYSCDLAFATLTYTLHADPGDYYRFSEQTFREVVFEEFEDVQVKAVMYPPRILGWGRKMSNPCRKREINY